MKQRYYIGIMSGTSMDGIDVALCRIDKNSCDLLESLEHPFPHDLKVEIMEMIRGETTLAKVGKLDHRLGRLFAEAVNVLLDKAGIDPSSVTAIGSHGQTLWHTPKGEEPFTMQLGDPNVITALTGIPVVADFRRKDMAYGGNGAPLAPAFHKFIFKNIKNSAIVANIGGIANISVLQTPLLGYDIGPGNMLMDAWIAKHKGAGYDKEGAWAREGKVDYRLLDTMMDDDYFSQPYPKSTGREKFNLEWIENALRQALGTTGSVAELVEADIQRTLLELTALSLSNEVLKFNPDILMFCGGGARNSFLVERIAALMPNIQVGIMEHADMLEAMMMAWFAYKRIHNEHVDLKEVTGAKRNTILGGIYQ